MLLIITVEVSNRARWWRRVGPERKVPWASSCGIMVGTITKEEGEREICLVVNMVLVRADGVKGKA